MALHPHKFREIVFQLIYSQDFAEKNDEEMIDFMMQQLSVTKKVMREAEARCQKILEKEEEIDRLITESSKSYNFERISRVERNILRLSTYELLFDDEIPHKVAIAEGIRIARKFGTPEGASFVNAILDCLHKLRIAVPV